MWMCTQHSRCFDNGIWSRAARLPTRLHTRPSAPQQQPWSYAQSPGRCDLRGHVSGPQTSSPGAHWSWAETASGSSPRWWSCRRTDKITPSGGESGRNLLLSSSFSSRRELSLSCSLFIYVRSLLTVVPFTAAHLSRLVCYSQPQYITPRAEGEQRDCRWTWTSEDTVKTHCGTFTHNVYPCTAALS